MRPNETAKAAPRRIRLDGGGGGNTQRNKRKRVVQTEGTTVAEESRREMTERVARYVPG